MVKRYCCGGGADLCPDQADFFLPATCSRGCAEQYMPLFSQCAETLWGSMQTHFDEAVAFEVMP